MGMFSFIRKRGTDKGMQAEPCVKKSVYLEPYLGFNEPDKNNILINDKCSVLYSIESQHSQFAKPLHDYEYLVFDSASRLKETDIPELKQAINLNIPVVVLCGHYESTGPAGSGGTSSQKREYPFFGFLGKLGLDFEFNVHYKWGREVKNCQSSFKKWWSYFGAYSISFSKLPHYSSILASNKANRPIAWTKDNFIFIPGPARDYIDGREPYKAERRYEMYKSLVLFLHEICLTDKEPEWANNVRILNENTLLEQKGEIDAELDKVRELKKLLYSTGLELEKSFEYALNCLGIKYTKEGSSDFIILSKPKIIVEVTGTLGNLKKEKAPQIWGHFEELKDRYGNDAKKLLFVNYERDKPPHERDKLETYTLNQIYKKNDIAVLTSQKLILFCEAIQQGKISADDFVKRMANSSGEVNL